MCVCVYVRERERERVCERETERGLGGEGATVETGRQRTHTRDAHHKYGTKVDRSTSTSVQLKVHKKTVII